MDRHIPPFQPQPHPQSSSSTYPPPIEETEEYMLTVDKIMYWTLAHGYFPDFMTRNENVVNFFDLSNGISVAKIQAFIDSRQVVPQDTPGLYGHNDPRVIGILREEYLDELSHASSSNNSSPSSIINNYPTYHNPHDNHHNHRRRHI